MNPQRFSYLEKLTDARVDDSPFDSAYLAQFQTRGEGKLLLRELPVSPDFPEFFTK